MTITRLRATLRSPLAAVVGLIVRDASAHCDTEDGPAVVDGRRALGTGNVNIALKWVHADAEGEVRSAFADATAGTARGTDEAAQRFLEILVRAHRAGEGAAYDGIKPTGTQLPPQVRAADQALEAGTLEPMRGLFDAERWPELERRFAKAMSLKSYDIDDVAAARDYVDAYVSFFKYAEGHDHDHDRAH